MQQGHGAPAAKRGMDERRLGGSAPDNCLLTASEQYTSSLIGDVSSHRLGRSSGRPFVYGPSLACPPTGVTGEHGHNGLLFRECPQSALKRVRAIWALVSGPKLTKSDLDPACSAKRGFFFASL